MLDGRDEETMDMIKSDLETAAYGFPVTFEVVPYNKPVIAVYVNGEDTGTILMAPANPLAETPVDVWWQISYIGGHKPVTTNHGDSVRAALARHLNEYVDKRVGLI